jgi:outer membrane lipoprotein carrier protein
MDRASPNKGSRLTVIMLAIALVGGHGADVQVAAQGAGSTPAGAAAEGATAPVARPGGASPSGVRDERVVAASVQAFYDQTRDVSAAFHQTYVNKLYQRTDRSRGRVVFKKPGKMRWDYALPNGKVIVSSADKLLVYEPGDPGEQGQVVEQAMTQAQLPAAMSFLTGTGRLEHDFTFRLLDAAREGFTGGDVLELRAKAPSPHYERILFYVESRPEVRGLVRRLLIIDAEGNRNRFDFTELRFNAGVADTVFQWTPPAGTRRVEM